MKKSNFVKLIAIALLSVLLLGVMAACDRTPDAPGTNQPGTGVITQQPAGQVELPSFMNPIGTLPIVNEPRTLQVFSGAGANIDFATNLGALEMEARTGVQIDWIQVPTADAVTRRNLMLATGDLPDIFANGVGTHAAVFHYASLGIFRPITPWMDFAPEMQRMFSYHPNVHHNMILPDGHIYGWTTLDDCFHCSMNLKLWVYRPWLDNLGLEVPRTPEELFDVLVAFRDGDPSGRGLNDEIPMAMGVLGWDHGPNTIINAWITNNQNRMILNNGQIEVIYDTPEYRDALRFLNRLYNEGLLAPESFVTDRAGLRQIADSGPDGANIVGVKPAMWVGGTSSHWRDGQWIVIPYLIGPNGHQVANYNPLMGDNRAVITSRVSDELMPVAVRWLDNKYTDESALLMVQGIEGINWRRAEPNEIGIHGRAGTWARLPAQDPPVTNTHIGQIFPNFRSNEFRLGEVADRTIYEQETILFDQSMLMLPHRDSIENIVPPLIFNEAVSAEIVDLETTLNNLVIESQARFIVGDLCLDADWDWYIRELNVIGLPRYLTLMQNAMNERVARLAAHTN